MPPLASPPTRGYPDGQRVENWDSSVLYTSNNTIIPPTETTGLIDVSRYGYLAGYDIALSGHVLVNMSWSTDGAGLSVTGVRRFKLFGETGIRAQYRLPNMGPWLRVTWSQLGSTVITHAVGLIGTNRTHPLEFIPVNPVLISQTNVAVGAGVTAAAYPGDYYAGPIQATVLCSQTVQLTVNQLSSNDTWDTMYATNVGAANTWFSYNIVTPPGAWRVGVENTSGVAGTYSLYVNHTLTGGS